MMDDFSFGWSIGIINHWFVHFRDSISGEGMESLKKFSFAFIENFIQ
jgi:hypothetical protein